MLEKGGGPLTRRTGVQLLAHLIDSSVWTLLGLDESFEHTLGL